MGCGEFADPLRILQILEQMLPIKGQPLWIKRPPLAFCPGQKAQHIQGIVQFVWGAWFRPGLDAHPLDRSRVEASDVGGGFRVKETPLLHRQGPALFRRGIVEKGIGPGVEYLQGQR